MSILKEEGGGEAGAHECIRPTKAWDKDTLQKMIYSDVLSLKGINKKHLSLYSLIFNRFMGSQCKDIEIRIKEYKIHLNSQFINLERIVGAKVRAFDFTKNIKIEDDLPSGTKKVKVEVIQKPEGYPLTQADVIRKMKERVLGRASTYSTILEKLFQRRYIFERKLWLFSTKIGRKVWEFLTNNFFKFISEKRTKILF